MRDIGFGSMAEVIDRVLSTFLAGYAEHATVVSFADDGGRLSRGSLSKGPPEIQTDKKEHKVDRATPARSSGGWTALVHISGIGIFAR